MSSIDRADWHYGGDFPDDLTEKNAGTHIGMFLNWIIDNNLVGSLHIEDSKEGIFNVKEGKITGTEFFFDYCDEKFWDEDLNEEGLLFTKYYYQNSNDPDGGYGKYIIDYETVLAFQYDTLYHVADTRENYLTISKQIDEVYNKWKQQQNRKPWQFWKK
jgi:hypothetical protein